MKRGPKPQPEWCRPKTEPKPRLKPVPAEHLSDTAKQAFLRVVDILDNAGILTADLGDVISLYASLYATWIEAEKLIQQHGIITVTPNGYPQQSPYLNISNNCLKQMHKILGDLGLTPCGKAKVDVLPPEAADADKWQGLLL